MKNVNDLIKHLKKYNDAVIIIGNKINPTEYKYSIEEYNSIFNRKNLSRHPKLIWDFFFRYLYSDKLNNSKCYSLINKISHSLIIDQNINGSLSCEYLHGHIHLLKCKKCKTIYPIESICVDFNDLEVETCEKCGGQIRPSVLLSQERYDAVLMQKLEENLEKTHTLIIVGLDYTEETLLTLISTYGINKELFNSRHKDEEKMLIAIQDKDEEFDPNELAFCDFKVIDDIQAALERLIKNYELN